MNSYKSVPWSSNSVEEKNTSSSSSGTDGTSPPNSMVVMLKTNPLIDECPGAKQLPPSNKPILLHGGGAFQSFSNTAMATVSIYHHFKEKIIAEISVQDYRIILWKLNSPMLTKLNLRTSFITQSNVIFAFI